MKKSFLLCTAILCAFSILAQNTPEEEKYVLHVKRSAAPIALDGVLDEAAWKNAERTVDFYTNFPFDTSYAKEKSEVWMTFDENFLYVGAVLWQKQEDYVVTSLKRDFAGGTSDVFTVNIDAFKDKLNGFHFAVSPLNVQREGIIDNGTNLNTDWDNKWYSAVKNEADRWIVEMAIPFKTLRYKLVEGQNTWRINFGRNCLEANEISTWSPVPRQFRPLTLAYTGLLVWDDAPPQPGANVSVIPYVIARTETDFEFKLPTETSANIGGDAKIAVTPSLNLDLTFNPDFSQVDVDRQITNLSRFELFFPERRQFFLENEDLFGRFGFPDSRPFFSRRIGLTNGRVKRRTTDGQDITVQRNVNVPILAGMRLSGKLDKNWRIGALNMQTGRVKGLDQGPANYSVGVIQRKVQERSALSAIFVNKENYRLGEGDRYEHNPDAFNRVAGLEYNFFSKDNKWESEVYYHRSFSSTQNNANANNDAQSAAAFLGYNNRHWTIWGANQYVGQNYRAEAGFVPRRGFYSIFNIIERRFFPGPKLAKKVNVFSFNLESNLAFNAPAINLTDRSHELEMSVEFPGNSAFSLNASQEYTYLFFPFDPTNTGGTELPINSAYTYNSVGLSYNSDFRKPFSYEVNVSTGQYFNGNIFRINGELLYRWQPYGIFALSYVYNDIHLPSPYRSANFWLVGPRAELSFSRSLFFSTFLQYNTQVNNVNINSRLQWRFKPVSDLFLVYSDNYFSDQFFTSPSSKNRALVLKMTYWLNL
jgi:hypothetical protein